MTIRHRGDKFKPIGIRPLSIGPNFSFTPTDMYFSDTTSLLQTSLIFRNLQTHHANTQSAYPPPSKPPLPFNTKPFHNTSKWPVNAVVLLPPGVPLPDLLPLVPLLLPLRLNSVPLQRPPHHQRPLLLLHRRKPARDQVFLPRWLLLLRKSQSRVFCPFAFRKDRQPRILHFATVISITDSISSSF